MEASDFYKRVIFYEVFIMVSSLVHASHWYATSSRTHSNTEWTQSCVQATRTEFKRVAIVSARTSGNR
jgi:hypothetical protein